MVTHLNTQCSQARSFRWWQTDQLSDTTVRVLCSCRVVPPSLGILLKTRKVSMFHFLAFKDEFLGIGVDMRELFCIVLIHVNQEVCVFWCKPVWVNPLSSVFLWYARTRPSLSKGHYPVSTSATVTEKSDMLCNIKQHIAICPFEKMSKTSLERDICRNAAGRKTQLAAGHHPRLSISSFFIWFQKSNFSLALKNPNKYIFSSSLKNAKC